MNYYILNKIIHFNTLKTFLHFYITNMSQHNSLYNGDIISEDILSLNLYILIFIF